MTAAKKKSPSKKSGKGRADLHTLKPPSAVLKVPWFQVAVLLVIACGFPFVLWQKDSLWRVVGYGVAFPAAMLVSFALGLRFGGMWFVKHLRWWAGLVVLGFVGWACLSFFNGGGVLQTASMGGSFGKHLLGGRNMVGVLRLIGYTVVAFALLAPAIAWALAQRGGRAMSRAGVAAAEASSIAAQSAARSAADRVGIASSAIRERLGQAAAKNGNGHDKMLEPHETQMLPEPAVESMQQEPISDEHLEEEERHAEAGDAAKKKPRAVKHREHEPSDAEVQALLEGESIGGWKLPSIEALDKLHAGDTPVNTDNEARAKAIEQALASYNIEGKVVEINPGPAVTQFGIEPGWVRRFKEIRVKDPDGKAMLDDEGKPVVRKEETARVRVKVDAIANLDKDLAMALAAPSIRIEAPIPGKALVGIEVPNATSEVVGLRAILESPTYMKMRAKSKLAVALGKGTGGEPWVADLAKMPHVLIAGATGSGKSVCINVVLACLLMQATPKEVQLLLIDPKRVEMAPYNSIPHLVAPVLVDLEKVPGALRWALHEMDERYKKFASVGARNLEAYNKSKQVVDPLPYLVIAIDELADLMMSAPYDVEHYLTRLAQLGRATGIHLVVATQRPSVDVVTGLIKANFPTRVSFAVSSQIDSRTILDTPGAEKLLGKGDMLYLPQDAPKPIRIQGVYVSDREVEKIVRAWNSQNKDNPPEYVIFESPDGEHGKTMKVGAPTAAPAAAAAKPSPVPTATGRAPATTSAGPARAAAAAPHHNGTVPPSRANEADAADDALFAKAKAIADTDTRLSPSLLSRRLNIGYTRAKRLMEELEEAGYADSEAEAAL